MIPRVVHFVFGLRKQNEPFHPLHAAAIESARRYVQPEAIHLHYHHLPWGSEFDRVRPLVTLHEVDLAPEVLGADYDPDLVPERYRYAHHADFVRLDVLIEHGGLYADIDTLFRAPFPDELFDADFVIGREARALDELTGEWRPSLCNALLLAEPGSAFARAWREQMAGALNGTWNRHSGLLAHELSLSLDLNHRLRVLPESTFYPLPPTVGGIAALLERETPLPPECLSVHLWAHLWWERERCDFSAVHAGRLGTAELRLARTTLGSLARPFLPPPPSPARAVGRWRYRSLDEDSGYGLSAERCRQALQSVGVEVEWAPYLPEPKGPFGYAPAPALGAPVTADVVVAHLVPEYLPSVRRAEPGAVLVGHTVWETDRVPAHWPELLDMADLVLAPSRFSAGVLSAATGTPVAVVPFPVEDGPDPPSSEWDWIGEETTVFYTVAEWNARKGVELAVAAYLRAFTGKDPVLLVVKTSARDQRVPAGTSAGRVGPGTSAWALARLLAGRPDAPAIHLDTRHLGPVELEALHQRGDCFVSLSRGEGWGMGAFAAASRGTPVVATAWGGHLDYLGGSPGLVDYRLVPVEDPAASGSYSPDQRWAEPDLDHAAQLLRAVMADPAHRRWARDRAASIGARFHPARVAETFIGAVERALSGTERKGPVRTDWLALGPGSGFGDAATAMIEGLEAASVPITRVPLGWRTDTAWGGNFGPLTSDTAAEPDVPAELVVVHAAPVWNEALERVSRRAPMASYTTWETDRLPDAGVERLNHYDLVMVPSRFNVDTFMASGVTVPLAVVPHIARPFDPTRTERRQAVRRFYTVGTWTARKALSETITAFVDAFAGRDDVSLEVYTTAEDHVALASVARRGWARHPAEGTTQYTVERLLEGHRGRPRVELVTARLTAEEVEAVHQRSHCFVSLTRGEGWGLCGFDAAAHGNPVVITGWGGTLDYLPEDYPYLVDYDLADQDEDEPDDWSLTGGRWARARSDDAVERLRAVADDPGAAYGVAETLAPELRRLFSPKVVTERLLEVLGGAYRG